MPPPYDYGSTQVDIEHGSSAGAALSKLRGSIAADDLGDKGLETEPHVTVKYGIIRNVPAVRAEIQKTAPFTIRFGKTKSFEPSAHSGTSSPVYVEVHSPELVDLNDRFTKTGAFKPADFEYHPHATLGYVKSEAASRYVDRTEADGIEHRVHQVTISDKDGNREVVALTGRQPEIQQRGGNPPMIHKTFKLDVKSVDEASGTFEGYASVFGNVDSDGEVVDKGAFKRTLSHNKGVVPILWQHKADEPIGWNTAGEEDSHGLRVKGQLDIENNPRARQALGFLKMGLELGGKPGLSIGFLCPRDGSYMKDGQRHFSQVIWKEYSVVTFPANSEATVDIAKEESGMNIAAMDASQVYEAVKNNAELLLELSGLITKGGKPTASVDGTEHPAEDFAYVPDPEKPSTWKFPIFDASHVRNALARWDQADIPAADKPKVLAKIHAAAKRFGIDAGKSAQDDFLLKDDGDMVSDTMSDEGSSDPGTFDDAMAAHKPTDNEMADHRARIEKALTDTVDGIYQGRISKSEKKMRITKAMHDYAACMSDWHAKAIDAEYAPVKSADGSELNIKDGGEPLKQATAMRKMRRARAMMEDGRAMIDSGHERHTKGMIMAYHVVRHGYLSNDLNAPNPAGRATSTNSDKTSDPGIHSLKTEDFTGLLTGLRL